MSVWVCDSEDTEDETDFWSVGARVDDEHNASKKDEDV